MNEDCLKLTSYFGERQRTAGGFAADALLDLYGRHEVATSILLRGMEGFGARRQPRTDRSLTLSEDLPLIAIAVDSRTRIEAADRADGADHRDRAGHRGAGPAADRRHHGRLGCPMPLARRAS